MHDHSHPSDAHHPHATETEPAAAADYARGIRHQREGKDAFFRDSPHSPIPPEERASFEALAYYPVEPSLRFSPISLGAIGPALTPETRVQTSDGAIRDGRRVGSFSFRVDGIEQRLTALQLAGSHGGSLFVPFIDGTSGAETYASGRYLDLEPLADGRYELDFNLAYAPFCAYSPHYSCPLPPAENRLTVAIRAGERNA